MKNRCPICFDEHDIDKYGWIQSCIGYMELGEFINKVGEDVVEESKS